MDIKRYSRRDFLRAGALTAMGLAVAACAGPAAGTTEAPTVEEPAAEATPAEKPVLEEPEPTETPVAEEPTPAAVPAAPVEGHVVVMRAGTEYEEAEGGSAAFLADNPTITIEFVEDDSTRYLAMVAAGMPPDLKRSQAPAVPQWLARGLLYDLTPFFDASAVLRQDDLAPANDYYRGNSALDIGQGPIYGMCKDWSPDFTMFIYKPAFEAAGVAVPDDTTNLTYQEVIDLARQLAVFEGDRVLMWGYGYDAAWTDRMWMNMLAETDLTLYQDDFTRVDLTGSEDAKAVIKYYFDLAAENLTVNPLNPSPSWIGEDFTKGTLAICQYGFWFGAMAESDVTTGQVAMLPTATWANVKRDPTMTATGVVMSATTKVPDAAWRIFEWYMGEEPAIARATSGWGVPALKSLYNLIPVETDYQQQKYRVVQTELALETTPLKFNPFLSEGAARDSWTKNLEQALLGSLSFDECLANVEAEVNAAIQEGIDRLG